MLRTLPILHLFEVFKLFWDLIWLGYCLNKFITLRRWSNDFRKNPNPKILKNSVHFEGVKWIEKFKMKKSVRGVDFHIVSNYNFFVFSIFQPIFFV